MQTIDVNALDLDSAQWVLDVGCGGGRHLHASYWMNDVNVVGLDLDRSRLLEARSGFDELIDEPQDGSWHLQQGDALDLPFRANSFDVVICSEVLEHLPQYQPALSEIDRVLKNDGQLAVSVPRFGPEQVCWWLSEEYHQVAGGHVRIFEEDELKSSIEIEGFKCEKTHYAHALHTPFWWLKCLMWDDQDSSFLIETYNKLLEWELTENPILLEWLEQLLNPFIGKSFVLYFNRENA
jgi:SAM-dependent methyltransferase